MKTTRTLLLLAPVLWLGGCAPATHHGDVRVTHVGPQFLDAFTFTVREEGTAILFPPVPLSKPGTTEFRVGNLPLGDYHYGLSLTDGPLYREIARRRPSPQIREPDTRLAVRVSTPGGAPLSRSTFRFGDLSWYHDASRWYARASLPDLQAADYRMRITVLRPSAVPGEMLHLRGFAAD